MQACYTNVQVVRHNEVYTWFPFQYRVCNRYNTLLYSAGLSLSRLFVPQCKTIDSTFTGISPFCILHNTCWVLSPLIPKFKVLTGSKNSDRTLPYLQSPLSLFERRTGFESILRNEFDALGVTFKIQDGDFR